MATRREMISRVRSLEKLLSADAMITDRVILRELWSKATLYIKQQTDKRRLWQSSTIFSNIPCIEMEPVATADCCDYISDQLVARSKLQLPKIADGIYGLLIHGVFSVESSKVLKEITLRRYINLLKLGLPTKDVYFWYYNKYLYVSSPYVKVVSLWAYFEEDISVKLLYPPCECANQNIPNPCINPLDLEFKCPGYLEDAVVKDTLETLMKTYFRVNDDKTSDNKDDQVSKV